MGGTMKLHSDKSTITIERNNSINNNITVTYDSVNIITGNPIHIILDTYDDSIHFSINTPDKSAILSYKQLDEIGRMLVNTVNQYKKTI